MAEVLSARALCALQDVKSYADPDDPLDATKDDIFTRLINAASNEIHRVARRELVAVNAVRNAQTGVVTVAAQPREFDAVDVDAARELAIGDLASFTAVSINGVALDLSKILALPRVREPWQPITRIRLPATAAWGIDSLISITGVWGFPAVPEDIRQAAIVTVDMWAARDLQTFSEVFVAAEGRVEVPRSLPQQAFDTVMLYKRRTRLASVRVGRER